MLFNNFSVTLKLTTEQSGVTKRGDLRGDETLLHTLNEVSKFTINKTKPVKQKKITKTIEHWKLVKN